MDGDRHRTVARAVGRYALVYPAAVALIAAGVAAVAGARAGDLVFGVLVVAVGAAAVLAASAGRSARPARRSPVEDLTSGDPDEPEGEVPEPRRAGGGSLWADDGPSLLVRVLLFALGLAGVLVALALRWQTAG